LAAFFVDQEVLRDHFMHFRKCLLFYRTLTRDTVSFGTALTWTVVFSLWKEFTSTWNQMYASSTSRNLLQSLQCFAWLSIIYGKTCFWVCFCSSYDIN